MLARRQLARAANPEVRTVKLLSRHCFVERLAERKGASLVSLVAATEPSMRKRGNPYHGHITKYANVLGMINWRYEASVNRQRTREGQPADFEAVPRAWGLRVEGTPFVVYQDKLYLELKVERPLNHYYQRSDGEIISDQRLAPWLPARPKPKQGVEKPIILRDYQVDHLVAVAHGGEILILCGQSPSPELLYESLADRIAFEAEQREGGVHL